MSSDDAKDLVTRYIENVWNRADLAALDDLTVPEYTYHLGGQPPRDRAAMRQFLQAVHVAFPDWRVQVETLVADGSFVAVRWNGRATHAGEFHGISPTGRPVSVCGINLFRIAGGKIAEEWEQMDSLGMLQQLGVVPPPPPQSSDAASTT